MTLPGAEPFPESLQLRLTAAYRDKGSDYKPRTRHLHADGTPRYSNRLLLENSPYLLQHAHNPVNWYPWCEEAFAEAERLQRPLFVSFGYSTCHWCHVMEEESFDNPEIAEYLNRHYISVKVDREVRPDLDAIYMRVVQTMAGQGGWPLSVWLFPDRQAFYGGTYFPPEDRYGRPGFLRVLQSIAQAFQTQQEKLQTYAQNVSAAINRDLAGSYRHPDTPLDSRPLVQVTDFFRRQIDAEWGGIGEGVKFPSNVPVRLLLRRHLQNSDEKLLAKVCVTLDKMADGGIYDHLGGGFHRYSTDAQWLVPHFEKMLYDNAQLSLAYLEAYQLTGKPRYREVVIETLDYIVREMTAPEGGFYSATDADSINDRGEAEEGWCFTWVPDEIDAVLPPATAAMVKKWFRIGKSGNLEGRSVLHTWLDAEKFAAQQGISVDELGGLLRQAKQQLLAERNRRPAPLRDDKIIVSWNGLMLAAFAKAGWVLKRSDYVNTARKSAHFVLTHMRRNGRLSRIYLRGDVQGPALLTDYAFFINGLLELYQADANPAWLQEAATLQKLQNDFYLDGDDGVYWRAATDAEKLLCREKPFDDGVMPSGNAVSVYNLLRLAQLSGDEAYRDMALRLLKACYARLRQQPLAMTDMLLALDYELADGREIVLLTADDDSAGLPEMLRTHYLPHDVIVTAEAALQPESAAVVPLLRDRLPVDGKTTAFVCRNRSCRLPVNTAEQFAALLRQ
ncbi:MAG: thioredoxin domain-containing protein [Gammaproteobacteria bacterium]